MTRAVRFDRYGGRDVLYVGEVEIGDPGEGEVKVEIRAAGLNPGEAAIREGFLHDRWPTSFPSGEGSDLAGVVTAVGDGVTSFAVGDEVLGWSFSRSSHAQDSVVPADQLIAKPAELSWEVAGSLYVVAATAYAAVAAVKVSAGDTVAVSAAAGGVGSVTVQLLAVRGAKVIGIASEANHGWLSSLGVVPVSYGEGLADRLRAAAPDGIDAFIDTFGEEYVRLAVDLGIDRQRIETIIAFEAASELGTKMAGSTDATNTAVLAEMADLVASGRIIVPIAATYALDDVAAAYEVLEQRHTRGKIVLLPQA